MTKYSKLHGTSSLYNFLFTKIPLPMVQLSLKSRIAVTQEVLRVLVL